MGGVDLWPRGRLLRRRGKRQESAYQCSCILIGLSVLSRTRAALSLTEGVAAVSRVRSDRRLLCLGASPGNVGVPVKRRWPRCANGFCGRAADNLFADPVAARQVVGDSLRPAHPADRRSPDSRLPCCFVQSRKSGAVRRRAPQQGQETRPTTSKTTWLTEGLRIRDCRAASCSPERAGRSGDAPHNKVRRRAPQQARPADPENPLAHPGCGWRVATTGVVPFRAKH